MHTPWSKENDHVSSYADAAEVDPRATPFVDTSIVAGRIELRPMVSETPLL